MNFQRPYQTVACVEETPIHNAVSDIAGAVFSISALPFELRQVIYKSYIYERPSIVINKSNASSSLHIENPLLVSSPFFSKDIAVFTFYQHSQFVFSSGEDMKSFSREYGRASSVRRIKILYGADQSPTRDWVYLIDSCFENLQEITFSIDRESFGSGFGQWWGCMRDACGEGLGTQIIKGVGSSKETSKGLILNVDDGEWSVCEVWN